jgi:hypothetical protein
MLKIAAAASALLGAAGLADAVLAHPHPEGEKEKRLERIVILDGKPELKGDLKDGSKVRHFRMVHPGGTMRCDGDKTEIDQTSKGGEKTKVFLCMKGDVSSADRVKHLEKALERINSDSQFSAEHRAKVAASIREAIEKARAAD